MTYKYEHYTENLLYIMDQATIYGKEFGEQLLKKLNFGLTLDQFAAIDILSVNPGVCQMDLAKLILKDRAYVSRLMDTLEDKGLVKRKMEAKGKRLVNNLYLTKAGEKVLHDIQEELEEAFKDATDEEMSYEEFEGLKQGITKFKNCIQRLIKLTL